MQSALTAPLDGRRTTCSLSLITYYLLLITCCLISRLRWSCSIGICRQMKRGAKRRRTLGKTRDHLLVPDRPAAWSTRASSSCSPYPFPPPSPDSSQDSTPPPFHTLHCYIIFLTLKFTSPSLSSGPRRSYPSGFRLLLKHEGHVHSTKRNSTKPLSPPLPVFSFCAMGAPGEPRHRPQWTRRLNQTTARLTRRLTLSGPRA